MKQNILFICGSLNQTTMMHKIARQLGDYRCYFTPFYADELMMTFSSWGWLDYTILGGRHRKNTEAYLAREGLPVDFGGQSHEYDLAVTCTDLIVQDNLRGKPLILVQEGMTEPEGLRYQLVRNFNFPRYIADTAATGLSDAYDLFCVASPGYRDLFISKGVRPEKIRVTGIPNFDDAKIYLDNNFPYRNFVLAVTSPSREAFKWDNRPKFIQRVREVAAGRQIIFKLHPNENVERSRAEIEHYAPEALILVDGNTNHMIANCDVLFTQYSSAVYVGMALGKQVFSYFDLEMLRKLSPLQNGGDSARRIANLARNLISIRERKKAGVSGRAFQRPKRNIFDTP